MASKTKLLSLSEGHSTSPDYVLVKRGLKNSQPLTRDGGNSSKRIFLKNIDFLVKTIFKDKSLQKNLYEDAASKEIFTLYAREEYNL